jgi:DNA repair exonuclease SbcCD nuclease subunit
VERAAWPGDARSIETVEKDRVGFGVTGSGSVLPYTGRESCGVGRALFRFLHAADIHLDSPLRGLERYEGAPVDEIRSAPRRALENLVQFAIDEEVEFLLLAGDLYDGDWPDFNTGLFFHAQMRRLEDAGIGVHLIRGNHDAASQITKQLSLPSNVVQYSNEKPETFEIPELGVAIHGQGFKTRSVTSDLAADFPSGEPDRFDIGLLHTSLDGRPGHDPYAPTSVAELQSKGYDYWALGHVHKREIVCDDPWIVFPGNLQGRHARETGAKGATLVTVEDGTIVEVAHRPLDVVRWLSLDVDIGSVEHADEIAELALDRIAAEADPESELLAVRVTLVGRSDAHGEVTSEPERWKEEFRARLHDAAGIRVFLEKVRIGSRSRADIGAVLDRGDAFGDLMRAVADLEERSLDLEDFVDSFRDLRKKLPTELAAADNPDRFDPTDAEILRGLLPEVRDLLTHRLLDAEPTE